MDNFKNNIDLCRKLFLEVLDTNDSRIAFIENALADENYFNNLPIDKKSKLDEALEILISNARVDEIRKMQQAHFGPLLGKINSLDIEALIELLKNDENAFIDYIQLLTIFYFRKDIETENHHHDKIRDLMDVTSKKIIKIIKE
jgi:hypothetical protein